MPKAAKQFGGKYTSRTRQDRGYDDAWLRLSAQQREWFPLCAACERAGVVRVADHTDHVIPFMGLRDPRRLDPMNLQSLCAPHNQGKRGRTIDYRTDEERDRQAELLGMELPASNQ